MAHPFRSNGEHFCTPAESPRNTCYMFFNFIIQNVEMTRKYIRHKMMSFGTSITLASSRKQKFDLA